MTINPNQTTSYERSDALSTNLFHDTEFHDPTAPDGQIVTIHATRAEDARQSLVLYSITADAQIQENTDDYANAGVNSKGETRGVGVH